MICSPVGVVTKKDFSKLWLILDIRFPSEFMRDMPLRKMESLRMLCDLVRGGDVMLGVDLTYGYRHIELHPDSRF